MGPFNSANFRRNRSNGVRSPNSWNITLNCVIPSLSFPSLFLVVAYSKNGWTDFHDLYLKQRGCTQGCAFWGYRWEKRLFRVSKPYKTPQKVGVVRRFQAKLKKNWIFNIFETISQINTKFDRPLKTAKAPSWVVYKSVGPNPRWRTAVILKKGKSPYLRFFRYLHQIWCAGGHGQPATYTDVISGLQQNPRWRPAAILKNGLQ